MRLKETRPRKRLKQWLRDRGETQQTWADKINVHHMTVWSWLNDKKIVPHPLALESISHHTPDCPLLREFK